MMQPGQGVPASYPVTAEIGSSLAANLNLSIKENQCLDKWYKESSTPNLWSWDFGNVQKNKLLNTRGPNEIPP